MPHDLFKEILFKVHAGFRDFQIRDLVLEFPILEILAGRDCNRYIYCI